MREDQRIRGPHVDQLGISGPTALQPRFQRERRRWTKLRTLHRRYVCSRRSHSSRWPQLPAACTRTWASSITRQAASSAPIIRSRQKCYLCLRYEPSPVCPVRTGAFWRREWSHQPAQVLALRAICLFFHGLCRHCRRRFPPRRPAHCCGCTVRSPLSLKDRARPRSCGNPVSLAQSVPVCRAIVLWEVRTGKSLSGPHRLEQKRNAQDLHRPLHVVRQHLQAHLRSHVA